MKVTVAKGKLVPLEMSDIGHLYVYAQTLETGLTVVVWLRKQPGFRGTYGICWTDPPSKKNVNLVRNWRPWEKDGVAVLPDDIWDDEDSFGTVKHDE